MSLMCSQQIAVIVVGSKRRHADINKISFGMPITTCLRRKGAFGSTVLAFLMTWKTNMPQSRKDIIRALTAFARKFTLLGIL